MLYSFDIIKSITDIQKILLDLQILLKKREKDMSVYVCDMHYDLHSELLKVR